MAFWKYLTFAGLKYAREHPTYNLAWNNCMVYTNEVWKEIH